MSIFHNLGFTAIKSLPPEPAHRAAIMALKCGLGPKHTKFYPSLQTELAGCQLPNPVGLAAGFDKNAEIPDAMLAAGFGFVEMGSVTPRPQAGNPKPRLFRLKEDRAVINRMGFNNHGLKAFSARLKKRAGRTGIVGANLGANKNSSDKTGDYVTSLQILWGFADYFTINISSPNTPGLRELQGEGALDDLLGHIAEARARLSGNAPSKPIFLKVAPDPDFIQIERITEQARTYGMSAIIVSNTTIARLDSLQSPYRSKPGGLSGAPLMQPSTRTLKEYYAVAQGRIPLIGAGGIASGTDAYAKIRAGAEAVQLYSALIYEGPALVARICDDLELCLKADGFTHISEAVGTAEAGSR